MSDAAPLHAEVLRGMQIESLPLRLGGRRVAAGGAASGIASARDTEENTLREHMQAAARQGREQGLREGYQEGLRQAQADTGQQVRVSVERAVAQALLPLQQDREKLQALHAAMEQSLSALLDAAEDEMVALCFETLCRLIGDKAVQQEAVASLVTHLRSRHPASDIAVLHVHPQDAQRLDRCPPATAGAPQLRWVADPEVKLGGCIVRAGSGSLDARLETMLSACKAALLTARAQRSLDEQESAA